MGKPFYITLLCISLFTVKICANENDWRSDDDLDRQVVQTEFDFAIDSLFRPIDDRLAAFRSFNIKAYMSAGARITQLQMEKAVLTCAISNAENYRRHFNSLNFLQENGGSLLWKPRLPRRSDTTVPALLPWVPALCMVTKNPGRINLAFLSYLIKQKACVTDCVIYPDGVNDPEKEEFDGFTPLHCVARYDAKNAMAAARKLLKADANPTTATTHGKLPWQVAPDGELKDSLKEAAQVYSEIFQ